jgi:membrane protein YqaA with SNARE-associated domain
MSWVMAFGASFLASLLPGVAGEVFVLAAVAVLEPELVMPLILVTAAGQVVGKLCIYGAARGGAVALKASAAQLARARRTLERAGAWASVVIFLSALASLPPYYVICIACGAFKFRVLPFVLAGYAGRVLRASILIWLPRLILGVPV